mmetsp:Transcript_57570/g.166600  ORF Transcript_57570/g.166600 Transcript_57570/m.166600 type:complete len:238 (+) Transcript_57570:1312-2025(+)
MISACSLCTLRSWPSSQVHSKSKATQNSTSPSFHCHSSDLATWSDRCGTSWLPGAMAPGGGRVCMGGGEAGGAPGGARDGMGGIAAPFASEAPGGRRDGIGGRCPLPGAAPGPLTPGGARLGGGGTPGGNGVDGAPPLTPFCRAKSPLQSSASSGPRNAARRAAAVLNAASNAKHMLRTEGRDIARPIAGPGGGQGHQCNPLCHSMVQDHSGPSVPVSLGTGRRPGRQARPLKWNCP